MIAGRRSKGEGVSGGWDAVLALAVSKGNFWGFEQNTLSIYSIEFSHFVHRKLSLHAWRKRMLPTWIQVSSRFPCEDCDMLNIAQGHFFP